MESTSKMQKFFNVRIPDSVENTIWYVIAPDAEAAAVLYLQAADRGQISVDTGEMESIGRLQVDEISIFRKASGMLGWVDCGTFTITPELRAKPIDLQGDTILIEDPKMSVYRVENAADDDQEWHFLAGSHFDVPRLVWEAFSELDTGEDVFFKVWKIPVSGHAPGLIFWEETEKSEVSIEHDPEP